jgi:hypothetical protein
MAGEAYKPKPDEIITQEASSAESELKKAKEGQEEESGVESKESEMSPEEIREIGDKIVSDALDLIKESFNEPGSEKEKLPFHNTGHTEGVIRRTESIMNALRDGGVDISDKDMVVAKIAAASHDTVQEWEESEQDGKTMRKRFAGTNEKQSSEFGQKLMLRANKESGQKIFGQSERDQVDLAIDATVPGFNPEIGTVIQPSLTPESSPITRAVAMADLGEAGMDPEGFLSGGDTLFMEENLDMLGLDPEELTDDEKESYKQRMLGWTKFQPVFARGRKAMLGKELEGLPVEAQENMKNLFDKFDESVSQAEEKAKKREAMSFEEIYADMGYKQEAIDQDMAGIIAPPYTTP